MPQLAKVALDTARTLLNDDGGQLWNDDALKIKLQTAHRELQVQLRANACPVTRKTIALPVISGSTSLSPPADLIEPITLWEKDPIDDDSLYLRMTEYDPLPVTVVGQRLIWWRWDSLNFEFIGAGASRMVKIFYKCSLAIPSGPTDNIGIVDGENYLGPRIAALAFGSTGNTQAADWCTNMATATLGDILVANRGRSRQVQRP